MQLVTGAIGYGASEVFKNVVRATFGTSEEKSKEEDEYKPDAITCLFLLALYQYLPVNTAIHFSERRLEFQIPGKSYIPLGLTRWSNGDSRRDTVKILVIVQKALSVIPPQKITYPSPDGAIPDEREKEALPVPSEEVYAYEDPITNIWLQTLVAIRRLQSHYGFRVDPLPFLSKPTDQSIFSEKARSIWSVQNDNNTEENRRASYFLHQAYMLIMEALVKEGVVSKSDEKSLHEDFIKEYRAILSQRTLNKIDGRLKELREQISHSPPIKLECKKVVERYFRTCDKQYGEFEKLVKRRTDY